MPGDILLTAKLHIPPLRADYVPRPRLVALLQDGLSRKLTLISTPLGFGKTSLVCEWLKKQQLNAAWVSLDEADNDHDRFIIYIMTALRSLNTGLDEHLQAISLAATQGTPIESPMAALLNDLAVLPATQMPVILVLDDYHTITNPQIHQSISYALEYIPEGVHIVMTSRTDPPLPLARMRARRQINELRAQDLRFTREESEVFLNQASGLGLTDEYVAALDERTEGWIAGLQLAALAMSGHPDIELFVRAFTGSHRYIVDYLVDEVFSRQPQDVRDFLLQTSLLERLTAGLCAAVTGRKDCRLMLERLERENLFIVPLDDQGQWYRYHHLFSDLLKNRAEQLPKQKLQILQRKAALWFDAHNQPYEAIGHALEATDYNLAIGMMVKATPALALRSEISTLLKWLNMLPPELKRSNPRIPLMYAWAHFFMTDIDAVEPYIQDALRALGMERVEAESWPESIPAEVGEMLAQVNALHTFVAVNRGEPAQAVRIANYALARLPGDEKLGRFAVLAALGDAYRDADNFAAASQTYSEALSISEVIDQYVASLTMRMDLARLRVKMGQLRRAETNCREVLTRAGEFYHPLFPIAQAYSLLGDILREQNNLKAAEQTLSASIRQCELAGYQRYLVYSHISAARLMLAQGNLRAVERSLEIAEQTAALSSSEPLQAWVRHFRARLLESASSDWLAKTHLSLEDEGIFQREDEYLTLARLHLDRTRHAHSTNPQMILRLLERLLDAAEKSARTGSAIEIMMLQALTLQILGRPEDALHKLQQSLTLAEPEGYVRLFVDEGAPMADLLLLAMQKNILPRYTSRLLELIEKREQKPFISSDLTEHLTEREGVVLRLLAVGLSNQQIGEKLVISLSTVKTHITRIYGKLNVTSRTQAIARARDLNLI